MQLVAHAAQGLQRDKGSSGIGGNSHGEAVDHDVLAGHAVAVCRLIDLFGDGDAAISGIRNSVLVQHQSDNHSPVFFNQRKNGFHALLLAVYGIDHGLSVVETHPSLHGHRV